MISSSQQRLADAALNRSEDLQRLSDADLTAIARRLATSSESNGQPKPVWLESTLAAFCEAVRRTKGFRPHPGQLIAAQVLAQGQIVEMATGEGKTIASAGAAIITALQGRRVHVMTQNNYLAARDYETLRPLYEQLGLSADALRDGNPPAVRKRIYRRQIIHGSGPEFGFDYLRQQNARRRKNELRLGAGSLQHPSATETIESAITYDFAVVDEIDSVLIDEAALPLVLSEPSSAGGDSSAVQQALAAAERLQVNIDYVVKPDVRSARLTAAGENRLHRELPPQPGAKLQRPWTIYVQQALQARCILQRNADYVVNQGKVAIVDQHTGRVFADRTWQEGLHQAVEAKEGVAITPESLPVARILRQDFMRVYAGICGLTGTMTGVEREFESRLGLRTVTIPSHAPGRRRDLPDRFFTDAAAKFAAAVGEIQAVHQRGRPVLVGTRTIVSTLELSRRLTAAGLFHRVLNGVQDAREAEIVAQAGGPGAITIATNLAGRGTDIRVAPELDALGGMHVLGLERHESRRVDLQLAGRTARQGAAGSSQFLIAADDVLIQRFGGALATKMWAAAQIGGEIQRDFAREVAAAQRRAEADSRRARERCLS